MGAVGVIRLIYYKINVRQHKKTHNSLASNLTEDSASRNCKNATSNANVLDETHHQTCLGQQEIFHPGEIEYSSWFL